MSGNMPSSIKITALGDIGNAISYTTLFPVVSMQGTPTTDKANLQIIGNIILSTAGGSYFPPAAQALLAQTVTNAAQPNITSVGTLTGLSVLANINAGNVNGGNIINANFYYGDAGHLANINVANVSGLGNIATVSLSGNSSQVLYGNGQWAAVPNGGTPGGNTTEIQYNSNGAFAGSDSFTFDGNNVAIISANFIANPGAYILEVYGANAYMGSLTDGGINIASGNTTISTGNTFIGSWIFNNNGDLVAGGNIQSSSFPSTISVGTSDCNIVIYTGAYELPGGIWTFDGYGNLTLPGNTFSINYANGAQAQLGGYIANFVFPNPTSNTSTISVSDGSDIVINPTYGGPSPAYINVPGNINGSTSEALQIYNGYFVGNGSAAAVSIGSSVLYGITIYGDGRVVTSNVLTVPASDNGSIVFSDNGTDNNGSLKVDGGLNMTLSANSNFYVKQGGNDRLAITSTNTDLIASTNVVIHANKTGTEANWTFDTTGNLTLPGNSVINETSIIVGGANTTAITLTPSTGTNADQKLLVYPTIVGDNNHLHLTSGNLYNTELFLGNDDLFVKLANTGNIIVNSNNGNGNSGQWEFGVDSTYGFGLLKGTGYGGGMYTYQDFVGLYAEDLNHNGIEMFANSHTTIQGVSNVTIHTNTGIDPLKSWIFDNTGNLTLPGNTFAINYANGQQVPLGGGSYGNSNVVTLLANYGSNTITTTGNVTTGNANIGGNLILASSSFITSVSGSNANINIDPDGTGAVVINGNIVANGVYANITNPTSGGTLTIASNAGPTSTTRIYSSASTVIYNNVSGVPVQALAITAAGIGTYANISPGGNIVMASGKNISSTNGSNANINIDPDGTGNVNIVGNANVSANISANYFIGNGSQLTGVNVSLIGNVTGTTPNVTLVAGSYNYVFDNTGNFTLPTNGDLIFSANTTLGSVAGSNGNIIINPDGTGQLIVTSTTPAVFGNTLNVSGNITASGSAGVITPNRPAFRVYGSSSTIWSTTTNTNGILNANNWAVDYNQGGYLNSSTGVFTAPVAGLYQLNLVCRVANNTSLSAQATVIKNYGSGNVNQVMWESANNPTINHFGVSTVSKLAAGDTLTLKITVGSLIFDGNDNWSVAYLG